MEVSFMECKIAFDFFKKPKQLGIEEFINIPTLTLGLFLNCFRIGIQEMPLFLLSSYTYQVNYLKP